MNIARLLTAGAAALCLTAAGDEPKVGSYIPVDGFFGETISEKWTPEPGFEPVKMTVIDRVYPVALTETDDLDAVRRAMETGLAKFYTPEQIEAITNLLYVDLEKAVEARENLGLSGDEIVEAGTQASIDEGMQEFAWYRGMPATEKLGADTNADKARFGEMTIGDMRDFPGKLQLPAARRSVEIIAPVKSRAKVIYSDFIPVKVGQKYLLSARLFSSANPSESEVRNRNGRPTTLDVEKQVFQKKIGGFAVYFYDKDQKQIGEMLKMFVTEDFQRDPVIWPFDIVQPMGKVPAYIRIAMVVAPANPAKPQGDPVEFSDIRLKYTAAPPVTE
ncbi:MAG: hypothetical protein AB7F40_10055 [Victivallaceae bacterium]|nr:hypothetical protein [Victivallaceae bacterium]